MHNQRFFDLSSVFHLTCFYSMLCQKNATIDNLKQPHSEHEIKANKTDNKTKKHWLLTKCALN